MRSNLIIISLILAATLLPGASCKRSKSDSTAATETVPSCIETNVRSGIAATCMACLRKNTPDNPANDGCCGIRDAIGLQLCQAASACLRAGGPPVGRCNLAGDTSTCYCGTNQVRCDAPTKANGPCIAEITAAAARDIESGTTDRPDPGQILHRYGDMKYALGHATSIAAIAGAYCKMECETGL
jgi:hypothetical protein